MQEMFGMQKDFKGTVPLPSVSNTNMMFIVKTPLHSKKIKNTCNKNLTSITKIVFCL